MSKAWNKIELFAFLILLYLVVSLFSVEYHYLVSRDNMNGTWQDKDMYIQKQADILCPNTLIEIQDCCNHVSLICKRLTGLHVYTVSGASKDDTKVVWI